MTDFLELIQRYAVENIFMKYICELRMKSSEKTQFLQKVIQKLPTVLYKEYFNGMPQLDEHTTIGSYSYATDCHIDFSKIKQSQLCQKYHIVYELLFLVTYLELQKRDLLSQLYGVIIRSHTRPLFFLKNDDYKGDSQKVLDLEIPSNIDAELLSIASECFDPLPVLQTRSYFLDNYSLSNYLLGIITGATLTFIIFMARK